VFSKKTLLACASAAAISGWGPAALAQADGAQIEEVVVTARRVQESQQDVPVAVTALSSNELRRQNVTTIRDLTSQAPSLYITSGNGGASAANVSIRGQTQADVLLVTDPSVAVYMNSVNLPRQVGLRFAMYDLASVEVLKGPQGTLFGKNTTGGALLLTTNAPSTTSWGGYVDVTGGNHNLYAVTVAANYPVIADRLGLRLAANKTKRDGYGENAAGEDLSNQNEESVRASVLWTPSDDVRLYLTADNTRARTRGQAARLTGLNPFGFVFPPTGANTTSNLTNNAASLLGLRPGVLADQMIAYTALLASGRSTESRFYDSPTTNSQYGNLDIAGLSADLSVNFGDLTFRSITGQRWINRDDLLDYSQTRFITLRPELYQEDSSFTQELQVLNAPEARLSWIAGGFFSREHGREGSYTLNLPGAAIAAGTLPLVNHTDGIITSESIAGFLQANYKLTDTIRITAGARYTKVKQRLIALNRNDRPRDVFASCNIPASIIDPGQRCAATLRTRSSDPSFLLSADWRPNDDVMVYAKVSSSFRGGGINERGNVTNPASYAAFRPEKSTEYEVGVKSDLFDRTLRLNLAAYYNNYRDVQKSSNIVVLTPQPTVLAVVNNAAKATVKGAEAEAIWRPIEPLTLKASGSWTHARYDKFQDILFGDRSGEAFPIPEWQYSLQATYVVPTPAGDLSLHASYRWQDDANNQPQAVFDDKVTQYAYGLWDARVSLMSSKVDGLEVAAWIKNITNKQYFVSYNTTDTSLGVDFGFVGDPRTYGVQIRKTFGGG
jgi:iron complex outermembrane recepter protein